MQNDFSEECVGSNTDEFFFLKDSDEFWVGSAAVKAHKDINTNTAFKST